MLTLLAGFVVLAGIVCGYGYPSMWRGDPLPSHKDDCSCWICEELRKMRTREEKQELQEEEAKMAEKEQGHNESERRCC